VKLLAHAGAPEKVFQAGEERIIKLLNADDVKFVDKKPNVLFFLTGGSERLALEQITKGYFFILLASRHDNSYASATEVKTYLNQKDIPSILLDEEELETKEILFDFLKVKNALKKLDGQRLGLIGQASDWLIASTIPADILKSKLGIDFLQISWSDIPQYTKMSESEGFKEYYNNEQKFNLTDTSKVNELLQNTIAKYKLDAITVECFTMVVNHCVTACLPLAKFNAEGFPAGCEGDIASITGMMMGKELTGIVPWIANTNKVTNDVSLFSHCTIAPSLVNNYKIKTHFETGLGTSIEGDFTGDEITLFRLDNQLNKAFVTTAKITGRPKYETACRTQIEVKLSENAVRLLQLQPLGNHHLIFPGNFEKRLRLACKVLGIKVLK